VKQGCSQHGAALQVSLVVCTCDRAPALRRCLENIAALQFDPRAWELIVVDNGSNDDTASLLRDFAARTAFRVEVLHETRRGKSNALNTGIAAASAPIVAFTDDDCYVEPDFLAQIVSAFESGEYGFIGGRVLLHDPGDAPVTIKEEMDIERFPAGTCLAPGAIHGANMAVRRDAWRAVGGFDPLLGPGGRLVAEEVDFLTRISFAGWNGAYLPGPTVRHHHGRKPGPGLVAVTSRYARGSGAYYIKGCLGRSTRPLFARHWYWLVLTLARHRRFHDLLDVVGGSTEYVWRRMVGRFAARRDACC